MGLKRSTISGDAFPHFAISEKQYQINRPKTPKWTKPQKPYPTTPSLNQRGPMRTKANQCGPRRTKPYQICTRKHEIVCHNGPYQAEISRNRTTTPPPPYPKKHENKPSHGTYATRTTVMIAWGRRCRPCILDFPPAAIVSPW